MIRYATQKIRLPLFELPLPSEWQERIEHLRRPSFRVGIWNTVAPGPAVVVGKVSGGEQVVPEHQADAVVNAVIIVLLAYRAVSWMTSDITSR